MNFRTLVTAALIAFSSYAMSVQAAEELLEIASREGVTIKALLTYDPASRPQAIAILLPGGQGDYRFERTENGIRMINEQRLPNRLRPLLQSRGIASLMVDSPSGMSRMSDKFRASSEHLSDLKAVIAAAASRFPNIPVYVIGHSNGTLSAAYLAGDAPSRIQGTVLIAGRLISHPALGPALAQFDWSRITTPVLLIHHRKDRCIATPYSGAADLVQKQPHFELLTLDEEAVPEIVDCGYTGTHNLVGQDVAVADGLAGWAKKLSTHTK